jgi:hypothetical protein
VESCVAGPKRLPGLAESLAGGLGWPVGLLSQKEKAKLGLKESILGRPLVFWGNSRSKPMSNFILTPVICGIDCCRFSVRIALLPLMNTCANGCVA